MVFADDCVGEPARAAIAKSKRAGGRASCCSRTCASTPRKRRTTRRSPRQLAALADVYVNDAFGAAHRAHASVDGMVRSVRRGRRRPADGEGARATSGMALGKPERPFVAILGGAKVSDKIEVIENLLGKVDRLLIGGAMAYTFLKARGRAGRHVARRRRQARRRARDHRARAQTRGVALALPVDHVVADRLDAAAPHRRAAGGGRRASATAWASTSGRRPIALYAAIIADAKTVVWNGPMGVFEIDAVRGGHDGRGPGGGRRAAARPSSAAATRSPRCKKAGVADTITHISTGGGASLEFLGGADAARRRGAADKTCASEPSTEARAEAPMRTPFIAGNWKMFKTVHEAVVYVKELRALVKDVQRRRDRRRAAVHRPARRGRGRAQQQRRRGRRRTATGSARARSPARSAPAMVREAGAEYVIIGHSERRTLFGETDDDGATARCARRSRAGPDADRLRRRNARRARAAARRWPCSTGRSSDGLDGADRRRRWPQLVIAYEPVWAIGTGRNATPAQAEEAHAHIRRRLRQWFGAEAAERCHVIYGGSVKPDNIAEI